MGVRFANSDTQVQEEKPVTKLGSVLRAFAAKHQSVRKIVWNLRAAGFARVELAQGTSSASAIRVLSIPGVYKPQGDSALLAEALSAVNLKPSAAVLDMCTGSGVLSIVAARLGAGTVTAVDVSRLAVICTRLNALLHGAPVRTRRGDLYAALGEGMLFDIIISNPPYMPSATDDLPTHGIVRTRYAGRDARALIDRVCAEASTHLRPGGFLLLVQASFCNIPATVELLTMHGFNVNIVARRVSSMARLDELARKLQQHGPWATDDSAYEIVVIRASQPLPDERTAVPPLANVSYS